MSVVHQCNSVTIKQVFLKALTLLATQQKFLLKQFSVRIFRQRRTAKVRSSCQKLEKLGFTQLSRTSVHQLIAQAVDTRKKSNTYPTITKNWRATNTVGNKDIHSEGAI